MNKIRFTLKAFAFLVFTLACATAAQAQATRTWVSGVGDDANPCSRTAPCKTFAGAISKTADGGEIDCIDSGGFGTVTLTKSVTIDGQGTLAGILAAGTNGVNVNDSGSGAPNTKIVKLRNLSIQGVGTGLVGINFTSGKAVFVENCFISGFKAGSGHGITVSLTVGGSSLSVSNTIIEDNSGDGVRATTTTGTLRVGIDNCRLDKNNNGAHALVGSLFVISRSELSNNVTNGVFVENTASANVDSCFIHSTATGAATGSGINAASSGIVRLANNNIVGQQNGVNIAGGTVFTFGDNKIRGNVNDVTGGTLDASTTKQ
jgi:hypothetical protein